MDGKYYIVTGADLHNLAPVLIGKRIRFTGYVRKIDKFPLHKMFLLSEDKSYYVIVPYGEAAGDVPKDLRDSIGSNGIRAAGGFSTKNEGDMITIYCSIEMLCKEGGLTGSALQYLSCIEKPVYDWERN